MDDNIMELMVQIAKLEAQVEYKGTLITWLLAVITALVSVITWLATALLSRSSKDSDAIRDRLNK